MTTLMHLEVLKMRSIRNIFLALSFLLMMFASNVHAQKQDLPKPGPEHKKLEVWNGTWAYEGTEEDAVFKTGGKFVGKSVTHMSAGGFVQVSTSTEKTYQGFDVTWYDFASKTYKNKSFDNSGKVTTSSSTVEGNIWNYTGTMTGPDGKIYNVRGLTTFSEDGKMAKNKTEISKDDGKTWMLWWEYTSLRKKK